MKMNGSKSSKLIRISDKAFEGLCALAGKLQARERRRVSLDGAVLFLLSSQGRAASVWSEEKTLEKQGLVHTRLKFKKSVFTSKKRGKTIKKSEQSSVVREPLKRFSLRHKKFVVE
ncbi:MAG: hypothetical protein QW343_00295 [Candidatus Norongarragalinales archaeon]